MTVSKMTKPRARLKIGVDFDNTIVQYDHLMYDTATAWGLIPHGMDKNKKSIRDAIRLLPDGETHWQKLQVESYGRRMHEAPASDHVKDFFRHCRRNNIDVYIVSHKTERPSTGGEDLNLRSVAIEWLEGHGFFDPHDIGLDRKSVFFESTRADKIERIKALRVTHFIDDLGETFCEPSFPADVIKILYAGHGQSAMMEGVVKFETWADICKYFFGRQAAASNEGVDTLKRIRGANPEMNEKSIRRHLSRMAKSPVVKMERIGKGGNSKVYRFSCKDGSIYAAKHYFQLTADGRKRMEVEFSALRFLWDNGVRTVPRPVAADEERQIAIYEYIDGRELSSGEISAEDIDKLASFLNDLRSLARADGSERFSPASDACFSTKAVIDNIAGRFERLRTLPAGGMAHEALHNFFTKDFMPVFESFSEHAKAMTCADACRRELSRDLWTLSPSDYGFHNALRRGNGDIVFLDFEYFGWDDPAKIISDFLLHPAMNVSDSLKKRFKETVFGHFASDRDLPGRFAVVYPLFGLKWCMILLNEFIPEHLSRRMFAGVARHNTDEILMQQLAKAQGMLHRIVNEHGHIYSSAVKT